MSRESFSHQIALLLTHLHNRTYLANRAVAIAGEASHSPRSPESLRRALVEAVEQLKPVATVPSTDADWRRYRHLVLRYQEGKTQDQIAQILGISVRQASRDHKEALESISLLLRTQWSLQRERDDSSGDSPPSQSSSVDSIEREVASVAASEDSQTDLAETVEGVRTTLSKLTAQRRVALSSEIPDTLPPIAIGRTLLRQALLNLLMDVIDASPGSKLRVSGEDTPRGVVLQVSPQPTRTRPETARKSVRPFTEYDKQAMTSPFGDGFSAGCRLLETQGGIVELETGSAAPAFSVVLPPIQLHTVLIVDDNPDVAGLFRRFLRGKPYRMIQATTGDSALRNGRELRPDVIVLDLMLPWRDGWEILQQLQHDPATKRIPVVVCSVLPERPLAISLGITDFLPKPVTQEALVGALDRCCSVL